MSTDGFAIDLRAINSAAERIEKYIIHTPTVYSERLSEQLGCHVYFKCENLQHVGAFKARGACNAVFSIADSDAENGVVTHSSGNHAAALARSAQLRNIKAHIVMPHNSAATKIAAVESLGVQPVFCEPDAESRAAMAAKIQIETNATLVHPFNDAYVMAGQGTVGLELAQDVPEMDVVLCPVGGGGLLSGVLTSIKSLRPDVEVIATEPAWADDAYRSWKSGRLEPVKRYDTVADGLRTPLGELPFPIIQHFVDDVLVTDEFYIRRATRQISEFAKLVAEPSGAVPLAAILDEQNSETLRRVQGKHVVCIITGGNIDFGNCRLGN